MKFIKEAWDEVSETTIRRCLAKAGVSSECASDSWDCPEIHFDWEDLKKVPGLHQKANEYVFQFILKTRNLTILIIMRHGFNCVYFFYLW